MPIPIVFFSGFPTWGSHSHLVEVRYTTGGPIARNVVCFGSPSRSSLYNNNPPYLCFPFLGKWYTYSWSRIKCGSYVISVEGRIINMKSFSANSEVCSLVSLGVRPFYIIFSWFSYFQFGFSYFGSINGIHIICWVICDRGFPWGSWDDV
jgi:hypothetical protein